MLHLQSEVDGDSHCNSTQTHSHETDPVDAHCDIDDACTDIELYGAELIPTRINENKQLEVPSINFGVSKVVPPASRILFQLPTAGIQTRAPPSIHWLTDLYIQKTVLRV